MNADGEIVLKPKYDAIGEFKRFGYAVMQREGHVGMLNQSGEEVVQPRFDDLKVLDSTLIAVMTNNQWMVINLNGKVVLKPGYERVKALSKNYLAYTRNQKWGLVDVNGILIAEPRFDNISILKQDYFLTKKDELFGLMMKDGMEVIEPKATEINIFNENLFFYKSEKKWGAVDRSGTPVLATIYQRFSKISDDFLKLVADQKTYLFSLKNNQVITGGQFNAYYPLTNRYVICKQMRKLGLIDDEGNMILPVNFNEIQTYSENFFRVNLNGRWGIVDIENQVIIPFDFDYISPMKGSYCVVIRNRKMGIANFKGEVVVAPDFDRIELKDKKANAFNGKQLTVFRAEEDGQMLEEGSYKKHITIKIGAAKALPNWNPDMQVQSQYELDDFEWFYSPQDDKWGLRKLTDGSVQIEPTFDEIRVLRDMGLTMVGIEVRDYYDFGRTSYRFEMAYGLVNNKVGLLVKEVDLVDFRLTDFEKGYPAARCVFINGRHGLINRIGKVVQKDYAFIGEFHNGMARMSKKGRLSASLDIRTKHLGFLHNYLRQMKVPVVLRDYTQFDQEIESLGKLTCENCEWGYLDTAGIVMVPPGYSFAQDFVNEVGIVECEGKWGMVSISGENLLPCRYDGVSFLENTDNQIIRIYQKDEKYGLIDTLGQLTVNLKYDDIGSFSEGRLAVMRNGMWGFANASGLEVIPCRFKQVRNFSEGRAAVKVGSKWGYIDKQGNVEIDFKFFRAGSFNNGKAFAKKGSEPYGYIDYSGAWVIEPKFTEAFDFDRGLARISEYQGEYPRMGMIDLDGNYIVRPRFFSISSFDRHGLAIVAYGTGSRFGLINLSGEIITSHHFREIFPFKEGLARVKQKHTYGFINTNGDMKISGKYSSAGDFSEGMAFVKIDGKCGYINKRGKVVIEPEFSRCMDFDGGKAVVFKGNQKGGLIDKNGNILIEPSINRMLIFTEGRGLVLGDSSQYYYITEQAQIYDGMYQNAGKFENGVAVVKENGRWGIINQKGIEIIPPKYDKIDQFEDGYAKVHIKGFNGLTNLQGELIIHPDYEYISYAGEGLFRVEQGDKIGYYDMEGNCVWGLME